MLNKYIVTLILFMLVFSLASADAGSLIRRPVQHYDISVIFNLEKHTLSGAAILQLPSGNAAKVGFLLNPDFTVKDASLNEVAIKLKPAADYLPQELSPNYGVFGEWDPTAAVLWTADIPEKLLKTEPLFLHVAYSGSLYTPPDNRQFSREDIAFEVNGTIGTEGIYLSPSAYWYPIIPESQATHTVAAHLPQGWNCVTTGRPEWEEGQGYTNVVHVSEAPIDGINFSAGPYEVKSIMHNDVMVMTYFLPAQSDLADDYIHSCRGYIDMYSDMIYPYPFPKFAVVDNFLPSGYGMPGWTLLGSEVLRLPFIRYTSLGHEILHNWFGNSMLVDYREGNWCEGITAYMADHKYKLDRDSLSALEYRRDVLRDYAAYVTPENDYPPSEFISRSDAHDRAIGYGKVTMVFHMLNQLVQANNHDDVQSPEAFYKALHDLYQKNEWRAAAWNDIESEFSQALGRDMKPWFDQWINKPGAPSISISNVVTVPKSNGWTASFDVITEPVSEPYQYPVTFRAISKTGEIYQNAGWIGSNTEHFQISGAGDLSSIQVDPDFNVFRKIYASEVPVTIASFFGDLDGILVVPSQGKFIEEFLTSAEGLKKEGQRVVRDVDVTPEMAQHSMWIFGRQNKLLEQFTPNSDMMISSPASDIIVNGQAYSADGTTATMIQDHPQAEDKSIVFTWSANGASPVGGTRKLPHYGKYSYLVFDGDRNVGKGIWEATGDSPLVWNVK